MMFKSDYLCQLLDAGNSNPGVRIVYDNTLELNGDSMKHVEIEFSHGENRYRVEALWDHINECWHMPYGLRGSEPYEVFCPKVRYEKVEVERAVYGD